MTALVPQYFLELEIHNFSLNGTSVKVERSDANLTLLQLAKSLLGALAITSLFI